MSLMEACKCSPYFPFTGNPQSWDMMYFKQKRVRIEYERYGYQGMKT